MIEIIGYILLASGSSGFIYYFLNYNNVNDKELINVYSKLNSEENNKIK